jgi:hypothetical protein
MLLTFSAATWPCPWANSSRGLMESRCLQLRGQDCFTASSSETSGTTHPTTQHHTPKKSETAALPLREPPMSQRLSSCTALRQSPTKVTKVTKVTKALLHPINTKRTFQFQQNAWWGPFHGKLGPCRRHSIKTRVLNMATDNRLHHTRRTIACVKGTGGARRNTALCQDPLYDDTSITTVCCPKLYRMPPYRQTRNCSNRTGGHRDLRKSASDLSSSAELRWWSWWWSSLRWW